MTTAAAVADQPTTTDTGTQTAEQATAAGASGIETTSAQSSQQTDPAAGATTETAPEEVSSGLISAEDYASVRDDPAALKKALLKGYTQKTQQLAAQRNELGTWGQIADAFKENPAATLKALGAQMGLEIRDPQATAAATTAEAKGDQMIAQMREKLEPLGLGDVADVLAPLIRDLATQAAGEAIEPLRAQATKLADESAQRETVAVLDAFGKKFPDWKQYDKQMTDLSKKLQPNGMNELEWMETLYHLVTREKSIAKATEAAIAKMTTSAQHAEKPSSAVAGDKVTAKAPNGASFRSAFEAAKRGERWE